MQNLPQKTNEQYFADDILKRALEAKIITPGNYAIENAVKSAWLEIADKGYFESCNRESIANAVMDMVVQGLNLTKEQGYFIKYGNRLKFFRSYLGSIAVAKRFDTSVDRINYAAIYGGDTVKIEIKNGIRFPRNHMQDFTNIRNDNVIGAYAIAIDHEGNEIMADIMTIEDIKNSWERSQKKGEYQPILASGKINPKSDHGKQTDRFACRTVVNRLCKMLISITDDSEILRAIRKSDEDAPMAEIIEIEQEEIREPKTLDFTPRPESQPEKESEPMANREQAEKIAAHHKEAGTDDKMMADISDFVGRPVEKIRYITQIEAAQYLDKLEAKDDEAPPWK